MDLSMTRSADLMMWHGRAEGRSMRRPHTPKIRSYTNDLAEPHAGYAHPTFLGKKNIAAFVNGKHVSSVDIWYSYTLTELLKTENRNTSRYAFVGGKKEQFLHETKYTEALFITHVWVSFDGAEQISSYTRWIDTNADACMLPVCDKCRRVTSPHKARIAMIYGVLYVKCYSCSARERVFQKREERYREIKNTLKTLNKTIKEKRENEDHKRTP